MVELMCPWDANILTSHDFKLENLTPLVADLSKNLKVFYYPIGISASGQVSRKNSVKHLQV